MATPEVVGGTFRLFERVLLALPDETMPYALVATNGDLLAGTSDGRVLRSADRGERFEDTGVRVGSISAMAAPR